MYFVHCYRRHQLLKYPTNVRNLHDYIRVDWLRHECCGEVFFIFSSGREKTKTSENQMQSLCLKQFYNTHSTSATSHPIHFPCFIFVSTMFFFSFSYPYGCLSANDRRPVCCGLSIWTRNNYLAIKIERIRQFKLLIAFIFHIFAPCDIVRLR